MVADTAEVLIAKVVASAPDGTVTVVGTLAGAFAKSWTTVPDAGALPLIVTRPVVPVPPVTVADVSVTPVTEGTATMKEPVADSASSVAVIVTVVVIDTGVVVTVNVAVLEPAATVTVAGTDAAELLPDSVTWTPPAGAFPVSVTVPVMLTPPTTTGALAATEERAGLEIVSVAVRAVPVAATAEIVALVVAATGLVVTANVVDRAPAGTVTVEATVAEAELLESVMTAPPLGARPFRATVPFELAPPATLDGLTATLVTIGAEIVRATVLVEPA